MRRTRRGAAAVVALLGVGVGVTGCGEEASAEDRACEARDELSESLGEVRADIAARNFGDAREELDDVEEAYRELRDAVTDLAGSDELSDAVDRLSATAAGLTESVSLSDLGERVEAFTDEATAITEQVADAVRCD